MLNQIFGGEKYTVDELNARLKFFVGIILGLTLFGIVFVVLYSLIFVIQPMNAMSPVDNKFFELIIPIATFLTGTLSGIMLANGDKDTQMKALEAATRPQPPTPAAAQISNFGGHSRDQYESRPFATANHSYARFDDANSLPTTFSSNGKLAPVQDPHPVI